MTARLLPTAAADGISFVGGSEGMPIQRPPNYGDTQVIELLREAVTWIEPALTVELSDSEVMEGRLRDPVYRAVTSAQ